MADCDLTLDILDPENDPVTNGALGIAPAVTTVTGEGVMVADEMLYPLADPFTVVTLVQGALYRFREYKPTGRTFYAEIPATATEDYSDLIPTVLPPVPPADLDELTAALVPGPSDLNTALEALIASLSEPKHGTIVLPAPVGGAADDTALADAIVAAGTQGLIIAQPGTYHISTAHTIGNGVDLRGQGGGSTSKTGTTTFKCTTAAAQIKVAGGGGLSGYFEVDGDTVATTPFARAGGTGANARTFHNITVHDNAAGANDLVEFYGAQNDLWLQCGFADSARDLGVFDQGFGGQLFIRCQWRGAGRYHHRYDNLVAGGVYLVPTDIKHIGGICEGAGGESIVYISNGANISYSDQPMYSYNALTGPVVNNVAGTGITIHNAWLQSTASTLTVGTIGIRADAGTDITLTGRSQYYNLDKPLLVDTNTSSFIYDWSQTFPFNCNAVKNAGGTATVAQIGNYFTGSASWNAVANSDYIMLSLNGTRSAQRFGVRSDGRLEWFPGTNFVRDVGIGRRAVGAVGVEVGTQQVFCTGKGTTAQRPAAAAALEGAIYLNTDTGTVDACDGTNWLTAADHTWTNATTNGITTNPYATGAPVGYTKTRAGEVKLRGLCASVTIGGTARFTLPVGYRPSYTTWIPIVTMTGGGVVTVGYVQILANGEVSVPAGAGGVVSFDGVSFMAGA